MDAEEVESSVPMLAMLRNLPHHIRLLPRKTILAMIEGYQQTLSPDHGPLRHLYPYGYCRHHPTCSMYGKQVIAQRGVIIGIPLLLARLLTCHPWRNPDPGRILEASKRHTARS